MLLNEQLNTRPTLKKIEVAAAIIMHENEILCMQRGINKNAYLSYKYEFPGGKLEPGESRTAALMRELKEEMDFDAVITENDFFLTVEHQYPDFEIVLHSFLCKTGTKEFVRKEHIDHKWLKREELTLLEWAPADVGIVEKLMKS